MNPWKRIQNRSSERPKSNLIRTEDIVREMFPRPEPRRTKNEPVATFTFGDVLARIWLNEASDQTQYLRISLHRIDNKNESERIRNSFRPQDFNDIIRAVRRCHIWLKALAK